MFSLVTDKFTNTPINIQSWQQERTVQNFVSLNSQAIGPETDPLSDREFSTNIFSSILRAFDDHSDWAQVHDFFSKRYGRTQMLKDRDDRKIGVPEEIINTSTVQHKVLKPITANFKTDPSSVGLPKDLVKQLALASRTVRRSVLLGGQLLPGPDPQPMAIGPAIGQAVGTGAYMDLLYGGQPPNDYPQRDQNNQGRTWAQWAKLWTAVADWVYEYDSTLLENNFLKGERHKHTGIKGRSSSGKKTPRDLLGTDAIDAADCIKYCFTELSEQPQKFQGIEWDYLDLMVETRGLRSTFDKRWGREGLDLHHRAQGLTRSRGLTSNDVLSYNEVSPAALKPCPATYSGQDWEAWILSIQGGDVVVVNTAFQVCSLILITLEASTETYNRHCGLLYFSHRSH